MSLFEDDRYTWRETYFILFKPGRRPQMTTILKGLERIIPSLRIRDSQCDERGVLEMLSVISLDDNAGLDIVHQEGDSVVREIEALVEDMQQQTTTLKSIDLLENARFYEAKLELMHFEQLVPIDPSDPGLPPRITVPKYSTAIPPYFGEKRGNPPAPIPEEKTRKNDPFANRKHFAFDPGQYIPPDSEEEFEEEPEDDPNETSGERVNPSMLLLVLELLVKLTGGLAIDPSSGSVLG